MLEEMAACLNQSTDCQQLTVYILKCACKSEKGCGTRCSCKKLTGHVLNCVNVTAGVKTYVFRSIAIVFMITG